MLTQQQQQLPSLPPVPFLSRLVTHDALTVAAMQSAPIHTYNIRPASVASSATGNDSPSTNAPAGAASSFTLHAMKTADFRSSLSISQSNINANTSNELAAKGAGRGRRASLVNHSMLHLAAAELEMVGHTIGSLANGGGTTGSGGGGILSIIRGGDDDHHDNDEDDDGGGGTAGTRRGSVGILSRGMSQLGVLDMDEVPTDTFLPDSAVQIVWDFVSMVAIIYYLLIVPYRICILPAVAVNVHFTIWIDCVVDAFFLVRIVPTQRASLSMYDVSMRS